MIKLAMSVIVICEWDSLLLYEFIMMYMYYDAPFASVRLRPLQNNLLDVNSRTKFFYSVFFFFSF